MIQQVTIRNFKSIGEVTVDLSPVTVLIGPSGVGKSNFLRAIRFLRNYLVAGSAAAKIEGGWSRIWPNGHPSPVIISVSFVLPGYEESFQYSVAWSEKLDGKRPSKQLQSEELVFGNNTIFREEDTQQIKLNQLPTSTEAVLAFAALTNGVGWHDFPARVLADDTGMRSELTDPNGQPVQWSGLSDDASNYLTVLRDLTQDLRDQRPRRQVMARLKQINPTVRTAELDSIQKPKNVVVTHDFGGQKIPLDLSQESDGFRRYYAHLLALYQTPPKQILMFEEPENGIYPGALRNLAEEFVEAPRAQRGQILLTTQSPELLDGFDPDSFRVVDLDPQTQQTRIGHLDRDQLEAVRDRLLEPGELLTLDKPRIAATIATGASHEKCREDSFYLSRGRATSVQFLS